TPTHPAPSTQPAFLSLISSITREQVDSFVPVRCPDADASARMKKVIERFRDAKDSIGGTVTCVIRNCLIGLGEPVFDKLEAMLAHAMLSIPATKGSEIGTGFGGCEVPGSVHNDPFTLAPSVLPAPNSSSSTRRAYLFPRRIQAASNNRPSSVHRKLRLRRRYLGGQGKVRSLRRPESRSHRRGNGGVGLSDALMAQKARESVRSLLPALKTTLP